MLLSRWYQAIWISLLSFCKFAKNVHNNASFQHNNLMEGLIGSQDTFVISTAFQLFMQTWSVHYFQSFIEIK